MPQVKDIASFPTGKALGIRHPKVLLMLLLAIQASLLTVNAFRNSPVVDEIGHFPAGLSHWEFGRFDLYRVNPPLVRSVAALPILFSDCRTEWALYQSQPLAREEMPVGRSFVAVNGERIFHHISIARLAVIPLSLLGTIVSFSWANSFVGSRGALFAAALYVVSPNLLAHGALITPDAGASSLGLLAAFTFWKWLEKASWKNAVIAGAALGFAELTKTTWLVLFVLWPFIFLAVTALGFQENASRRPPRTHLLQLSALLVLGLYILNAGYLFTGTFTRLGSFQFKSVALSGIAENANDRHSFEAGNQFSGSWLAPIPVPLPRSYVEGIDLQKYDFEVGQPSYLRGEWRDHGWLYYYVYALAVKMPTGVLFMIVSGLLMLAKKRFSLRAVSSNLPLVLPPLVILVLVSSQTGFNKHLRYVLPVLPFLFVALGCAFGELHRNGYRRIEAVFLMLLIWSAVSSIRCCPNSLAHFNELAGGPPNGHEYLLGSNVDWGQGLVAFTDWNESRTDDLPLFFSYRGMFDPADIGISCRPLPITKWPQKPGWYAISLDQLYSFEHPPEYLLDREPHEIVYNTIAIFRFD